MSSQTIIKVFLTSIFFLALQVLFVRNLVLYDVAFCFLYLIIILGLPGETNPLWVIVLSFGIGLFMDMFYNTAGVHAAACTLIGFLRRPIVKTFSPVRGVENDVHTSLSELGHQRYFAYITLVVFIHHVALFFIEAGGFHLFGLTLLKVLSSLIFTVLVVYLVSVFSTNISKKN